MPARPCVWEGGGEKGFQQEPFEAWLLSVSSSAPSHPSGTRPHASSSMANPEEMRLMALAQHVQEVLPHVPLAVICKDLGE